MSQHHRDVLYCEHSGDIVRSFEAWNSGHHLSSETSITFSGQFFEICRSEKLTALAISSCARKATIVAPSFTVANIPRWECRIPRIGYEISVIVHAMRLLLLALRVRPKIMFVASGTSECLYLSLLRLSGAKIVYVLHNTLWPEGFPPKGAKARFRMFGARLFWRHAVAATLAVSPTAARQAEAVGAKDTIVFKPTFPNADFARLVDAREFAVRPFRILFAGRIEEDKGVFDILEIARSLRDRGHQIEFVLCGSGRAQDAVRRAIAEMQLQGSVRVTGKLGRAELIDQYLNAHLVIVPTRSTFPEGFAMVAAEAILLLRPVITSKVVPATELLRSAMVLATTDDVESYVSAVEAVLRDESHYRRLVENAKLLRPRLLDDSASYSAALRASVHRLFGDLVTNANRP